MSVTVTPKATTAPVGPAPREQISVVTDKTIEMRPGISNQPQANSEVVATPATPAPAATPDPMEQFAKREKQLHASRQKLAAEKAELEKKIQEYSTGYISKERISADPVGILANEMGISAEKLAETLLSQPSGNDPVTRALLNKIQAIEAKQQETQKALEQREVQNLEQAKKQIHQEVMQLTTNTQDFEIIKAKGLQQDVVEYIEQQFNKTGYLMDVHEAATKLEEALLTEAIQTSQLSKVRAKTLAQAVAVTTPSNQQSQPALKTITNSVAQANAPKRLTERERVERAKAAFYGTLKG